MIIRIKAAGFNEKGENISITVTRKKMNGIYGHPEGKEDTFFPYDDIQILQMSNEEKNMSIDW